MQLGIAFLNHYHANTKTDLNVPKAHLDQVWQDNDGYGSGFDSDKAYAYDDHYWVIAEATNDPNHRIQLRIDWKRRTGQSAARQQ